MDESPHFLFVYGTLRDASVNHKAHYLRRHGIHVGPGSVQARLYKVTWYPAIILGGDPDDRVVGEIWELPMVNREMILHELDGYEGIYSSNDESEEYERVVADVETEDGSVIKCWIYNYKLELPASSMIKGGDYLAYLADVRTPRVNDK